MSGRMKNRVAIVTGGGSGIGGETALRLAEEGAAVLIADLDPEKSGNIIEKIKGFGGRAEYSKLDVRIPSDADTMVAKAIESFGSLDTLVNNVGGGKGDDLINDLDEETWDFNFNFSLKPTYYCCRAAMPKLLESAEARPGAAIVNLSSVNGMTAMGLPAYAAAKAGVEMFTKNIAIQYGKKGVRSNLVAPYTTRTDFWKPIFDADPATVSRLADINPMRRIGNPIDIANAILFLASDEASFVNGALIPVDGGFTAGTDIFSRSGGRPGEQFWSSHAETGNF
jgi:meso-butanediol dehydrogenase/(S,S)-butanediol dehydrogenase/diacetyl reductase